MEKLLSQIHQIDKIHASSQVWHRLYTELNELTEIRNSQLYALLLDFTNNPTDQTKEKLNNAWKDDSYDKYMGSCYFKANVINGDWSLAIMSNDHYWDPCIVSYTSEIGLRLDDDIKWLKEKLDKQTEKLTQAINDLTNGKEV